MKYFGLGFLLVVLLDQSSKLLARQLGWVMLNAGVSFNIGHQVAPFVLTAMVIIFFCSLFLFGRKVWEMYPLTAGMFFGGGASNIFDRIMYGGVRDWLSVPFLGVTNNLADIAIVAAIVLLLVHTAKEELK